MSKHQKQRLIRMKVLGVPLYKQCMENGKKISQHQIEQRLFTINSAYSEDFKEDDIRELCQLISLEDLKSNKDFFKKTFYPKVFDSAKYSNTIIDLKVYKKMLEQLIDIGFSSSSDNLVYLLEEIDKFLYTMYRLDKSNDYNQYSIYGETNNLIEDIEERVKKILHEYNKSGWFNDKLEKYVSEPDVLYKYVNTFEDLCKTNEAFLLGRMPYTFYYGGEFGSDSGVTHLSAANTLSILNGKYYVFTMDGQSNDCEYKEATVDSEGLQQRSYLLGYMDQEQLEKLLPHLLMDDRIYISILYNDYIRYYDNFPRNEYILNVTRDKEKGSKNFNYFTNTQRYDNQDWSMRAFNSPNKEDGKNVIRVFYNKVFFEIIVKEYCYNKSADDILLEHCKRIL